MVPTRDRPGRVATLLERLADCEPPAGGAELVVVDDGSRQAAAPLLQGRVAFGRPVRVVRQGRLGPARARNRGAAEARGAIVLFLADDLRVPPGLLRAHAGVHRDGAEPGGAPLAAVGPIRGPSGPGVRPFERFLASEGVHFAAEAMRREAGGEGGLPYYRVHASSLSVPRERFVALGGFDPGFPMAAYEDVELAHRWVEAGGRLSLLGEEAAADELAVPGSRLAGYLAWKESALPSAYRALRKVPPLAAVVARPRPPRLRGTARRALLAAVGPLAALDDLGVPLPRALYRSLVHHFQVFLPVPAHAEVPVRAGRVVRDPVGGGHRFDSRGSDSVLAGELLLEAVGPYRGMLTGRVLEVGCGDGPLRGPLGLAPDGYLGLDPSPAAGAAAVRADGARLPLGTASVDGVLCSEVLEHVRDPAAVLAEAARVLGPGGWAVVTAPFFYRLHDLPEDRWRFTEDGLVRLVRGAGLEVVRVGQVGGAVSVVADVVARDLLPVPARALRRLAEGRGWRPAARLAGAVEHRLSVGAQRSFLVLRRLGLARLRAKGRGGRVARFLWDRSSRMCKGYVVLARKPEADAEALAGAAAGGDARRAATGRRGERADGAAGAP